MHTAAVRGQQDEESCSGPGSVQRGSWEPSVLCFLEQFPKVGGDEFVFFAFQMRKGNC